MRTAEKRRRSRWWIGVVLIAAVVVVAITTHSKGIEIETAVVDRGTLDLQLSCTGIVESDLSDVSPKIFARIVRLYVEENQFVEEEQLLAELESEDLQADVLQAAAAVESARKQMLSLSIAAGAQEGQLKAAVDRARASLEASRQRLQELEKGSFVEDIEAQRAVVAAAEARAQDARVKYVRAKQLLAQGAISEQDRDSAKTAYDASAADLDAQKQRLDRLETGPRDETLEAARADVKAAQAAVAEAEAAVGLADASKQDVAVAGARMAEAQASLDRATTDLSYTAVRSPIAGTVARKHMEEGEMATPTEPIYTVASRQGVWVSAEIDEIDAAAVAVDQQVAITLDAYPGTKVMGRVVRVSPIAEPKEVGRVRAKVLRAKVVLEPHDIPLKPGMEVNVTGSVSASKEALLVPNDAVMRVGGKDKVFVVRGDTAVETEVEVGQSSYDYTQIKSGLKKGDQVATSGLGELSDGARVRVSE